MSSQIVNGDWLIVVTVPVDTLRYPPGYGMIWSSVDVDQTTVTGPKQKWSNSLNALNTLSYIASSVKLTSFDFFLLISLV